MSDTPRTDDEAGTLIDCDEVVPANFARQLERELAAAQARMQELEAEVRSLNQTLVGEIEPPIYVHCNWLESQIETIKAREARMREALEPLKAIADAFDNSGLDEARPEWGDNHHKEIEIYSGRGGKRLLTLAHCFKARAALDNTEAAP